MHYWSVWHEGKPFSAYYDVTPRFCSEFGYQSFPSVRTIRTYAEEADFNVTSPVMEHHQQPPARQLGHHGDVHPVLPDAGRVRELRLPQPGPAGAGNQDRRGVLAGPAADVHGHALLAAERQLARLLLVIHGIRRLLEAPPLRGAPVLCTGAPVRLDQGRTRGGEPGERPAGRSEVPCRRSAVVDFKGKICP